ncbi:Uncharacterised protein [Mycobacteroides abscessus]|nr:Uncharacterised protein [Mycobacteroides abscessus]
MNSGGQNAVASAEYSSLARARSTPSARIRAWSNARPGPGPSPSRGSTACQAAPPASDPACTTPNSGASRRYATERTGPRGSRSSGP